MPGEYKAPRSRTSLHDYDWYCLDHIRAHNQKWDFFNGMGRPEIEAFMKDAVTGHRPTWKREDHIANYYEQLHDALNDFLGAPRGAGKPKKPEIALNSKLREALAAFNIEYPYSEQELKICYRGLVKKFHPDANKGNKNAEEKFKEITTAYLLLREHLKNQ